MNRTPATLTGFAICVVLGALDVLATFGAGMDDAPPLGVVIAGAALGLGTLAGAVPAWRGSRTGLLVVVATRVLSVLLGLPVYFTEAPGWARIAVTATIVATAIGVALLVPALRQRPVAVR